MTNTQSTNPLLERSCAEDGCYFRKALDERQALIDALSALCEQVFAAESGLMDPDKAREHNGRLGEAHSRARLLLRQLEE